MLSNSDVLSMDTLKLGVTLLSSKPSFFSSGYDRMKKALDILSEFCLYKMSATLLFRIQSTTCRSWSVMRQEPRKGALQATVPQDGRDLKCHFRERNAENWSDPLYLAFTWKMSHKIFSHVKKMAPLPQTVLLVKKERKRSMLLKSNSILNTSVLYLNLNSKIQWFPMKSAIFNSAAIVNLISPEKQLN